MTDVNHDLFVKVLTQIEREPRRWRQRSWRSPSAPCGTAYCFAGWAVRLSGIEDWKEPRRVGAQHQHISDIALELLGLTYPGGLFLGTNTLDDLYEISADHIGIDEQVLRDKVAAEVQS